MYKAILDYQKKPNKKEIRKIAFKDGIKGDYFQIEKQRDPTTPIKIGSLSNLA